MGLLRRIEQAQQGADTQSAGTLARVPPPTAPTHAQVSVREDYLSKVRLDLLDQVIGASDSLFGAAGANDVHSKVEAIVDQIIDANGFTVRRDERLRLIEEVIAEIAGFGPHRAAPPRRHGHRGHGQRPEPGLHRAQRQARADQRRLPERRARQAHHRSDHRPDRPPHRRVEPEGRRPPARRLARQRDHRAAVARRTGDHRPQVRRQAVHGGRPRPLRHGDGRDVRLPAGLRRGPPQHLRLRRHRLGQDDDAQRPLVVHPRATSGSSRSRTRPSCSSARSTSSRWSPGRRTSRAKARSRSATCCATPCTCAPTGSSWASAAAARPWT